MLQCSVLSVYAIDILYTRNNTRSGLLTPLKALAACHKVANIFVIVLWQKKLRLVPTATQQK